MTTTAQSATTNAYLRTKVLTAKPEELRLMLLDGAIKFARQGRDGLAAKDYEASYNGISQCRNIVIELINTIRPEFDPELCDRVRSLYAFFYGELVTASFEKDVARLDKIIGLLEYERETWVMLMEQLASERTSPAAPAEHAGGARQPLSVQA